MSNKVKEYQIEVILAGGALLTTGYRSVSKDYADRWFRNIAEALKDVEEARVFLYSREVPVAKLEQKFEGGE